MRLIFLSHRLLIAAVLLFLALNATALLAAPFLLGYVGAHAAVSVENMLPDFLHYEEMENSEEYGHYVSLAEDSVAEPWIGNAGGWNMGADVLVKTFFEKFRVNFLIPVVYESGSWLPQGNVRVNYYPL